MREQTIENLNLAFFAYHGCKATPEQAANLAVGDWGTAIKLLAEANGERIYKLESGAYVNCQLREGMKIGFNTDTGWFTDTMLDARDAVTDAFEEWDEWFGAGDAKIAYKYKEQELVITITTTEPGEGVWTFRVETEDENDPGAQAAIEQLAILWLTGHN